MRRLAVFVFVLTMAMGFVSYASNNCETYCDKYEHVEDYEACIDGCDWSIQQLNNSDAQIGIKHQNAVRQQHDVSLSETPSSIAIENKRNETLSVDGCAFYIETGDNKIYIPNQPDKNWSDSYTISSYPNRMPSVYITVVLLLNPESIGIQADNSNCRTVDSNKHFGIGNSKESIIYSANSDSILVTDDGNFTITSPGDYVISAMIRNKKVSFPIKAILIPVVYDSSNHEVIRSLGYSDKSTLEWVNWPNSKSVDGILYTTEGGINIRVDHWYYNRFPDATLVFSSSNRLTKISMKSWERFSSQWYSATR